MATKWLRISAIFVSASEVCQKLVSGAITERMCWCLLNFCCRNYDLIGWPLEVSYASLERQVSLY